MVFVSSGGTPANKEAAYRLDILKDFTAYLIWRLNYYLTLVSSDVVESFSLFKGVVCMSFWDNLGLTLREDFLGLFTTCPEATDPISRISVTSKILTSLKVLTIDSRHEITLLKQRRQLVKK